MKILKAQITLVVIIFTIIAVNPILIISAALLLIVGTLYSIKIKSFVRNEIKAILETENFFKL